ncbi:HSP70/90 co-chaperone [Conoideocrella luteorostrata]|uniref:HSP70/90 co-chaperone n=1 Tax=Conoideocrella luteorostrata TaxID=1105319 RepID=A0AAJ0FVI6_9HYPO|nr:HSP70/90 co-chaperone [Conoideocrella luteorostrata]
MKIEEISDGMERTNLEEEQKPSSAGNATPQPASQNAAEATKPELPPIKKQTFEEVMADLNKCPLFMTDMEENDDIAALQALNYEGTPLENGIDFKMRGNDCFKVRGYVDAREFYSKGIQILFLEERKRARGEVTTSPEGVEDSAEEIASQRDVLGTLYMNRAACHLELDNYRSCWTDCAAALRLNPTNVKAHYRSAKALLAVDRIEEADDVCARGLALDSENKALKQVAEDIVKRAKQVDEKNKKTAERLATAKRRELLLRAALKARNILTRTTGQPPEMGDTKMELVPDPDDPRSSLSLPTVLLYPEDLESDFIKAFNEMQTLEEHLSYVFPLPWDKQGVYTVGGVSCYVETKDGGVLKMGKRVPLLKVLGTGKVEVVDQVVRIHVLPTNKAHAWVETFKKAKAAELAKAKAERS